MATDPKVFIAGSRRLSRLNPNVRQRLDNIVDKDLSVIIGDANGVDKSVQHYLNSIRYANVTVFCMEGSCRNNIGDWPTRAIRAVDPGRRDFAYYSTKDRAMAAEADYGLMLWDGQSRGTLTNIVSLVRQGKPVVVYFAPGKTFQTVRQPDQLAAMLGRCDPEAFHGLDRELRTAEIDTSASRKAGTALLF
jgi:hypothetical protein